MNYGIVHSKLELLDCFTQVGAWERVEFILDIAPHNAYLIPDSYDFGISSFQSNGKGDGFAHGWVPGSVRISGGSGHGLGGFDPLTLISDIYKWFKNMTERV